MFDKSTISFSQTSLKVGASFRNENYAFNEHIHVLFLWMEWKTLKFKDKSSLSIERKKKLLAAQFLWNLLLPERSIAMANRFTCVPACMGPIVCLIDKSEFLIKVFIIDKFVCSKKIRRLGVLNIIYLSVSEIILPNKISIFPAFCWGPTWCCTWPWLYKLR